MATGKRGAQTQIEMLEDTVKALELRRNGMTFREIAKALGCSVSRTHDLVREALADLAEQQQDGAKQLRYLLQERLQMSYKALAPRLQKKGVPDYKAIKLWNDAVETEARLFGVTSMPTVAIQNNITLQWSTVPALPTPSADVITVEVVDDASD